MLAGTALTLGNGAPEQWDVCAEPLGLNTGSQEQELKAKPASSRSGTGPRTDRWRGLLANAIRVYCRGGMPPSGRAPARTRLPTSISSTP